MKSAKLSGEAGSETRVAILVSGEEAFATLTTFANDAGITAASLTAIGAFESATVGWFDFEKKTYKNRSRGAVRGVERDRRYRGR
ncbi:putative DNA-binding protein with PD1-like motif [Bradyrhizobium japonicum USDA 38]|nr:putative DNA-binding protein with PD1-like motif [Bradyrhizobium japonicum USDA 38]MCS3945833.1 putative DNA-binding protein with PD1-like motif [Bradyrhizobium japonicum]